MGRNKEPNKMSLDEYLDFLEQYWAIFGPPPPPKKPIKYKKILL